jgi:hypothetical protein
LILHGLDEPIIPIFVTMIIYAIPGFGTTAHLFSNLTIKSAELIVLDWPLAEADDTMQTYARKFLPQIDTTTPFCLLGVSFGGMLCGELSRLVKPQKIFLISSSKFRKELPWFIRIFKHIPLYKYVSESRHRKLAYHGRWMIGFSKAFMPEFMEMVNSMNDNYFMHCIHIIVNWNRSDTPENVLHIHGSGDRLILYGGVKPHHTIKGGSHAMVVFRADEISSLIEEELRTLTT